MKKEISELNWGRRGPGKRNWGRREKKPRGRELRTKKKKKTTARKNEMETCREGQNWI